MNREVLIISSLCLLTIVFFGDFDVLEQISAGFITAIFPEFFRCSDDISCYGEKHSKAKQINYPEGSIFMISSSCNNKLSVYECCAIESVSRGNNKVHVLVTNPLKYFDRHVLNIDADDYLSKGHQLFQNKIHKINIYDFVKGTPVERIFVDSFFNISIKHKIHRKVREVLKLVALYRFGGVVIDLEMLVVEPEKISKVLGQNGATKIAIGALGGAVVALNKKTIIGKVMLKKSFETLDNMTIDDELDVGYLLTRAYKALCYKGSEFKNCRGFRVLMKSDYFYPLNLTENHKYFEPGRLIPNTYGYYLWDTREVLPKRKTLYWKLMKKYCPKVHSLVKKKKNKNRNGL